MSIIDSPPGGLGRVRDATATRCASSGQDQAGADSLGGYLSDRDDFGFASYQPESLFRRIDRRMRLVRIEGYAAYREFLEADPDEMGHLIRAVPVHRTEFFRDPDCWAYLSAEILPRLAGLRGGGPTLRGWSAGCSTGQEAYSLSIALAESAGPDALARGRVLVFATDVSDDVLAQARTGRYRAEEVRDMPEGLRDRYFLSDGDDIVARPELRNAVRFARHDLLRDVPLGRMSLITCRNILMYFTVASQVHVLAGLSSALADGGFLLTGRADAPHVWCDIFEPQDYEHRVYRKRGGAAPRWARPVGTESRIRPSPGGSGPERERSPGRDEQALGA